MLPFKNGNFSYIAIAILDFSQLLTAFSYRSSHFAIEKVVFICLNFCISFVDWFMATFLYCFPYSYRSPNYCDSNSCRSFTLLNALAKGNGNLFAIAFKSDNYRYLDSWKSDTFREIAIKKEAKNWYQKGCKEDQEW